MPAAAYGNQLSQKYGTPLSTHVSSGALAHSTRRHLDRLANHDVVEQHAERVVARGAKRHTAIKRAVGVGVAPRVDSHSRRQLVLGSLASSRCRSRRRRRRRRGASSMTHSTLRSSTLRCSSKPQWSLLGGGGRNCQRCGIAIRRRRVVAGARDSQWSRCSPASTSSTAHRARRRLALVDDAHAQTGEHERRVCHRLVEERARQNCRLSFVPTRADRRHREQRAAELRARNIDAADHAAGTPRCRRLGTHRCSWPPCPSRMCRARTRCTWRRLSRQTRSRHSRCTPTDPRAAAPCPRRTRRTSPGPRPPSGDRARTARSAATPRRRERANRAQRALGGARAERRATDGALVAAAAAVAIDRSADAAQLALCRAGAARERALAARRALQLAGERRRCASRSRTAGTWWRRSRWSPCRARTARNAACQWRRRK
jgi:hypothetical protein